MMNLTPGSFFRKNILYGVPLMKRRKVFRVLRTRSQVFKKRHYLMVVVSYLLFWLYLAIPFFLNAKLSIIQILAAPVFTFLLELILTPIFLGSVIEKELKNHPDVLASV